MSKTKTMSVKIKVKSFVEWDDPFNDKVKHCRFYVPIKELPVGLPIEPVNTRPQNIKQKLYQNIVRTATNTPELFHHNNNGLFVVVRNFEKNRNSEVILNFGPKDGIGDGAHSYLSCLEANKRTGGSDGFVSFNVVSKLDEKTLKKSCLSRNSSISNKTFTRYNYEGKFDLIKQSISSKSYANLVSYRENESSKRIPVRNLIAISSMFIGGAEKKDAPVLSYVNKTYTLEKFVESTLLEEKNPYNKINDIIPDFCELYDFIAISFSDYQEGLGFSKDNFPNFFRISKTKIGHKLYFKNATCRYLVNESIIYPILSSLRIFLKENKNGKYSWKKPMTTIQKHILQRISKYYKSASINFEKSERNFFVLGKNQKFWAEIQEITSLNC